MLNRSTHQLIIPMALISRSLYYLFLFVVSHSTPSVAQETDDEKEFDYTKGGKRGPEHWGEIHKEWVACKNGTMQSPIDIPSQRVHIMPRPGKMKRTYKLANATLLNRGHDIAVKWTSDAGSININGTEYKLQQCHWHSPSEHTIRGRRYELELHMVHEGVHPNVTNKIAVVSQLYKFGPPDSFLAKLTKKIRSTVDREGSHTIGMINPRDVKLGGRRYYRYLGSLTVPPCTEGVVWTINKRIRTVSNKQVELLREAVHDYADRNARPLQQLKNIKIYYYDPLIHNGRN